MEGQVSTCHIVSARPKPALPASARRRAGSSSSTGVSSSRSAGRSGGHSCAASDARLSIDLTNLASPDARESSRLPSAMTDFRSLGAALGQRLLRVSVRSPERCLCQRIWSASRASHLSLSIALQHHRSCFCRWEIHSRSSHARMLDRLPQSFLDPHGLEQRTESLDHFDIGRLAQNRVGLGHIAADKLEVIRNHRLPTLLLLQSLVVRFKQLVCSHTSYSPVKEKPPFA